MEGDVNWGIVILFSILLLAILGTTFYIIIIAVNNSQPQIIENKYQKDYELKTKEGISYCQKKLFEFVTVRKVNDWEVLCQTKSPYKTYVQILPD